MIHNRWSPTANELVIDNCYLYIFEAKKVIVAQAPDFDPVNITADDLYCRLAGDFEIYWTPDGKKLIYFGPTPADYANDNYFLEREIWLMERDGSSPHPVNFGETSSRGLEILGWMDDQTLVYKEHSGTGMLLSILDILTGEHFGTLVFEAGDSVLIEPNSIYMVASSCPRNNCFINALTKSDVSYPSRFSRLKEDHIPTTLESTYEDRIIGLEWLPGTNKLMVRTFKSATADTRLSLWDVEDNSLTLLAANGYEGNSSPDGRVLAFIEIEPIKFEEYGELIVDENEVTTTLHIRDVSTKADLLSTPFIIDLNDWRTRYSFLSKTPLLQFSPDSRYLAFFTSSGVPNKNDSKPEGLADLNIFDLTTKEIIFSELSSLTDPVWSPNSDQLLYQNEQHNWIVLDLSDGKSKALTRTGGRRLGGPHWSFDGSYLSLSMNIGGGEPETLRLQVVIFETP